MQGLLLSFAKEYWWLAIVAGVAIYAHFRISNLKEVLEAANAAHREQIVQLKDLHQEELDKRDKLIENYKKKNRAIERKYKKDLEALKKVRVERVETVVKMFEEDPETLKQLIAERYGFVHVDSEECITAN